MTALEVNHKTVLDGEKVISSVLKFKSYVNIIEINDDKALC